MFMTYEQSLEYRLLNDITSMSPEVVSPNPFRDELRLIVILIDKVLQVFPPTVSTFQVFLLQPPINHCPL